MEDSTASHRPSGDQWAVYIQGQYSGSNCYVIDSEKQGVFELVCHTIHVHLAALSAIVYPSIRRKFAPLVQAD